MRKKVLSLFCGCGGLDLGFQNAGFETIAAFDMDRTAVSTFNENFGEHARIADLSGPVELAYDPDVVIAGPPCQGFSTGSGYSRADDPRNSLLLRTCEIIQSIRPKVAVIENVSALGNSRNLGYLADALAALRAGGYHADLRILNAEEFGVPQIRRRLVIVATKLATEFSLNALKAHPSKITLEDALRGIGKTAQSHEPVSLIPGSRDFLIASRIGPGQKLCNVRGSPRSVHTWDIPEVFGATSWAEREILLRLLRLRRSNRKRAFGDADPVSVPELQETFEQTVDEHVSSLIAKGYIRLIGGCLDLTHTFNGKYKRLRPDGFAPTVDTRFGDFRLFLHPTENRAMTVREAARIQGFPDTFKFPTQRQAAFRLIGNAVPPPLAGAIATLVAGLL